MKITLLKEARTFLPEIMAPGTGLSPATERSVLPTANVITIQDILNGKQYKLPGAGGDWSSGEDTQKDYNVESDDYKRQERDIELIQKMLNHQGEHKEELWEVRVPGGKKTFVSQNAANEYKQKLEQKGLPVKWVTRKKMAQVEAQIEKDTGNDKVELVAEALKKTFMVESINMQEGMKLNGSAFCVAPNYFLTCAHVVKKYNKNLQKKLDSDEISATIQLSLIQLGQKYPAKLITIDAINDIAIISCDTSSLKIIPFTLNSEILVGEDVLAVGSPHGYENNTSFGTVGSLGRKIYGYEGAPEYMFIDAAAFNGNSGGPIIKQSDGSVIGMLTAIVSANGDYGLNAGLPAEILRNFCIMNKIGV